MSINTIIVDDERPARDELAFLLKGFPDVNVVAQGKNGLEAVAHGGTLVAIGTAFDKYPIALVLTNDAIKRMGITPEMSLDEKIKRLHGLRIGITSPGSSTDEFMRTIMMVRGMDPDKDVKLQPIGIGAPMVAAMQQGMKSGGFRGTLPNPYRERSVVNLHRNLAKYMGTGAPRTPD